jgi:SulP family sulfate permease
VITFLAPYFLRRFVPKLAGLVPGTLIALIVVSLGVNLLNLPVAYLKMDISAGDFSNLGAFFAAQIPPYIDMQILMLAAPFALKLAALCYVDTLLTSLIVDKMRGARSRQNKELMAQGLSNGVVGLLGGVPGAQSTVPSVLTIKEGATMRLAGICAGAFILIEMVLLSALMTYIPLAVFTGILIKVGYDVFDFRPLLGYARTLRRKALNRPARILGHKEMTLLSGTALATAFIDLIAAVGLFTILFHVFNKMIAKNRTLVDFTP